MSIRLNPDPEMVALIKEGIERRGGHCPCIREMSEDTLCICKDFRTKMADPDFEGYCHCMLYYKERKSQ